MENTNKILPENTIPAAQGSAWKVWVLAIVNLLFQSWTWYWLNHTLYQNSNAANWVFVALYSAIAISTAAFFILVNKSRLLADAVIVLSAVVYGVLMPHNLYVWIGGLIFALFGLWYEQRLHRAAVGSLDFSVTRVIGGSASLLIYAVLILLGFNLYYKSSIQLKAHPDDFYNAIGHQAAKTVPYFTKILPGNVDINQPLADYFQQQAQANPNYGSASSFERQILVSEAKKTFQDQFQIAPPENETLADVVAQIAVNKIKTLMAPYQDYLPIIFAVSVVALLYWFAFLIRWLILIVSWLLFGLLRAVGFFKLRKVQVEVEKLEI